MKHNVKVSTLLLLVVIICSNNSNAQLTNEIFHFVKTVHVTPDANYLTGSFSRINYNPATNNFVVTFGAKASIKLDTCIGAGYAYKEYSLDMQETNNSGLLVWYPGACEAGDAGSTMFDTIYFLVTVPQNPGYPYGLNITKFTTTSWTRLGERFVYMIDTNEMNSDPCVAFFNNMLDVSDQYNPYGISPLGLDSRHHLFSANLDSIGVMILDDSPHISGASMIYVEGKYYLLSATEYAGDLVVLKYDNQWNYLGTDTLIHQANWSQGVAFDGNRFYVAYQDTRLRTEPAFFPVHINIHLAAFDKEWNLLYDTAVTNFDKTSYYQPGRPWVIYHLNRLYVSYDVDSIDVKTNEEMKRWQARVSIYDVVPGSTGIGSESWQSTGNYLEQNYPNPFSAHTTIHYRIQNKCHVTLKVIDLFGKEITTIIDDVEDPGIKSIDFDSHILENGVYLYCLHAGDHLETRRFIILK
jgi:hypothetical protein